MVRKASKPRLVKYVILLLLLVTFMQDCFGSDKSSDDNSHKRKSRYDKGDIVYVRDEGDQEFIEGEVIEVSPLQVKPKGWENAYEFQEICFGCETPEELNVNGKSITEIDKLDFKKKTKRLIKMEEEKEKIIVNGMNILDEDYLELKELLGNVNEITNNFSYESVENFETSVNEINKLDEDYLEIKELIENAQNFNVEVGDRIQIIKSFEADSYKGYSSESNDEKPGLMLKQKHVFLVEEVDDEGWLRVRHPMHPSSDGHFIAPENFENIKIVIDQNNFGSRMYVVKNDVMVTKGFDMNIPEDCLEIATLQKNVEIEIVQIQKNLTISRGLLSTGGWIDLKENRGILVWAERSISNKKVKPYYTGMHLINSYSGPYFNATFRRIFLAYDTNEDDCAMKAILKLKQAIEEFNQKNIPKNKNLGLLTAHLQKLEKERNERGSPDFTLKQKYPKYPTKYPYSSFYCNQYGFYSQVYNHSKEKRMYLASAKYLDNCAINSIKRLKALIDDLLKKTSTPENEKQMNTYEILLQTLEKQYKQRESPTFISNKKNVSTNEKEKKYKKHEYEDSAPRKKYVATKSFKPYSLLTYDTKHDFRARLFREGKQIHLASNKNPDACATIAITKLEQMVSDLEKIEEKTQNEIKKFQNYTELIKTLKKEYADRESQNFPKVNPDGNNKPNVEQEIPMTIPICFQELDENAQQAINCYIQAIFQDHQLHETRKIITDELKDEFGLEDLAANDVYNYFKSTIPSKEGTQDVEAEVISEKSTDKKLN